MITGKHTHTQKTPAACCLTFRCVRVAAACLVDVCPPLLSAYAQAQPPGRACESAVAECVRVLRVVRRVLCACVVRARACVRACARVCCACDRWVCWPGIYAMLIAAALRLGQVGGNKGQRHGEPVFTNLTPYVQPLSRLGLCGAHS